AGALRGLRVPTPAEPLGRHGRRHVDPGVGLRALRELLRSDGQGKDVVRGAALERWGSIHGALAAASAEHEPLTLRLCGSGLLVRVHLGEVHQAPPRSHAGGVRLLSQVGGVEWARVGEQRPGAEPIRSAAGRPGRRRLATAPRGAWVPVARGERGGSATRTGSHNAGWTSDGGRVHFG
ncbi:Uncharacterized protein SCF082_LOCUS22043, partial [Durusdinium trenchii]